MLFSFCKLFYILAFLVPFWRVHKIKRVFFLICYLLVILACENLRSLLQVTSSILISIPFIKIFFLRCIFPFRDIARGGGGNSQSTD